MTTIGKLARSNYTNYYGETKILKLIIFQVVVLKKAVQTLNLDIQKFSENPEEITLRPTITGFFSLHTMCREVNEVFGHQVFLTSCAACLDVTYCLFASCKGGENNSLAVDVVWAVLTLAPEVAVMTLCQQVDNAVSLTLKFKRWLNI